MILFWVFAGVAFVSVIVTACLFYQAMLDRDNVIRNNFNGVMRMIICADLVSQVLRLAKAMIALLALLSYMLGPDVTWTVQARAAGFMAIAVLLAVDSIYSLHSRHCEMDHLAIQERLRKDTDH